MRRAQLAGAEAGFWGSSGTFLAARVSSWWAWLEASSEAGMMSCSPAAASTSLMAAGWGSACCTPPAEWAWDTALLLEMGPDALQVRRMRLHAATCGGVMRRSLLVTGMLLVLVGARGAALGAGIGSRVVGLGWWLTVGRHWPHDSPTAAERRRLPGTPPTGRGSRPQPPIDPPSACRPEWPACQRLRDASGSGRHPRRSPRQRTVWGLPCGSHAGKTQPL